MSKFSGKCDLCDHVYMGEGSEDELFEKFKKRTGGKLYQKFVLRLTPYNIDYEVAHNNFLEKVEENGKTKYRYFSKVFPTLKSLNKHGYWATRTIYFDRKIDLIPYYPYIIAMSYYSDEKAIIFIANESFIDQEEKLLREYKSIGDREESPMVNYYRRALADEYIKVVKEMLEKEKEKM